MTFIRAEAWSQIKRYKDCIVGILISLVGVKFLLSIYWPNILVGLLFLFLGTTFLVSFFRKYITSDTIQNVGFLEVTERQIIYIHAINGGVISLDALKRISLIVRAEGNFVNSRFWDLEGDNYESLRFPVAVPGVDAFIDSLIFLTKVNYGAIRIALDSQNEENILVWEKITL